MANLTAVFDMVDNMSAKLENIANVGSEVVNKWQSAGTAMDSSFTSAATAADGVASSANSYGEAIEGAAGTTDYWTDAVGSMSKSLLEATHSTEELVEMGYKSSDALEEERGIAEFVKQATDDLNEALENSASIHDKCATAMESAAQAAEQAAQSDNVSEEAKEALQAATESASAAFEELEAAQKAAQEAMDNCNAVAQNENATIKEIEAAAMGAANAADELAAANEKAANASGELSKATEEVSKAVEDTTEKTENSEESGVNAIEGISNALAAAGITATVKEIAESVYELTDAYSDAEKTIVNATGAVGDSLDDLGDSMLDAYAQNDDGLDETAAAVGELNTRLGLTGDELAETTQDFMDFADVTSGTASTSVRNVTQLMNQWNVSSSEMSTLMDKLTYAGQASGISVDTLSSQLTNNKAILDQLGFSLDEAIAMFMNFELAGTNSTAVMTGFRTALSSGAISSLDELYEVFDQISSGAMTAADASEMFGSRAGSAIVNAVNSGVLSLDDLVTSLENSEGTMDKTAEAGESLSEKWEKAGNSIKTAFTKTLEPSLSKLSSGFAGVVNQVGTFLQEHPTLTKAITAIGVGMGTVAVGVAGVSAAMGIATAATTAFGVALTAALGPISLIAAGVAGVSAAVMILGDKYSNAYEETMSATAATREMEDELETLQSEYETACDTYGDTSEEANRLRYEIDDLTEALDDNGKSVTDLIEEVDNCASEYDNLKTSYEENLSSIDENAKETYALVQKLEDLSETTGESVSKNEAMESIIDELNKKFPELQSNYDGTAESLDNYIESVKEAALEQEKAEREEEKISRWAELSVDLEEYKETLAEMEEKQAAAQKEANAAQAALSRTYKDSNGKTSGWNMFWAFTTDEAAANDAAQQKLNETTEALEEQQNIVDQATEEFNQLSEELGFTGDTQAELTEKTYTWEEAVNEATSAVEEDVTAVIEAYQEAYDTALTSFEGQFSLFDEASTASETYVNSTVANAQAALDSQLNYWETYSSNIATLKDTSYEDLGITKEQYQTLMSYVSDGSEEAAGLAASMVSNIKSGNEEAVGELAETLTKIQSEQEEAADDIARVSSDIEDKMDELQGEMEGKIEDLDLGEEATEAATSTFQAYADSILANKGSVVAAADQVTAAVKAALAAESPTITIGVKTSTSTEANANGTTNSADVFIAGERGRELVTRADAYATGTTNSSDFYIAGDNGPELIVGEPGSTVFPNSETERIIDSINRPLEVNVSSDTQASDTSSSGGGGESTKRIILEIAGSGKIDITDGVDEETVVEILNNNIKPVLMNIMQSEIYEEGESSYEY